MEKQEQRESIGKSFYLGFHGNSKVGQSKQFRIGQFESFWQAGDYQGGL